MPMFVSPVITSTVRDSIMSIATDTLNQNRAELWWREVAQEEMGRGLEDIYTFALQAAKLQDAGVRGQQVAYDTRQYLKHSVIHRHYNEAFALTNADLTDLDSNRIQAATDWVRDITQDGLYNPQRLLADGINRGAAASDTTMAYDGLQYFSTQHPVNGRDTVAGVYANRYVGTGYDISKTVSLDVAIANLSAARQKIKVLKDPSGKPRNLKVKAILAPSPLYPRLVQVIQAQYAPGSSIGGGGGTQDVSMLSQALGFGRPLEAVELGTDFDSVNGSDTAYYILAEYSGPHAPFVLSNREPFHLFENSMGNDAWMAILNQWEWVYTGRQALMSMHPYLLHRFSPT